MACSGQFSTLTTDKKQGKMPHKKGTDRNQLYLLPPSLEDFITEDNPVRIIEAFVNTLDFEKLQFKWIFRSILTPEIGKKLVVFSHFRPVIPADTDPPVI